MHGHFMTTHTNENNPVLINYSEEKQKILIVKKIKERERKRGMEQNYFVKNVYLKTAFT